jgi:hypothetical protein
MYDAVRANYPFIFWDRRETLNLKVDSRTSVPSGFVGGAHAHCGTHCVYSIEPVCAKFSSLVGAFIVRSCIQADEAASHAAASRATYELRGTRISIAILDVHTPINRSGPTVDAH